MKRSILCEEFMTENEVESVSMIDSEDEGHFRRRGCECCKTGLGTTVVECHGYSRRHGRVLPLGDVCFECINWFYNGEDSEVEK